MYNEVYKNAFLEEQKDINENTYKQLINCFNAVEEYEKELQKDISCFTLSEIIGVYKSFSSASLIRLQNLNCQLSKYADWCNQSGIIPDKQNHFKQVNLDVLEQCLNSRLHEASCITREELLKVINSERYNPSENFLMLALFEGICGNEYIEIRELHLNAFKNGKVTLLNGEKYTVSEKLIELANESAECTYYMTANGKKRLLENDPTKCYKFPDDTSGNSDREKFFIVRHLNKIKQDTFNGRDNKWAGSKELKESGRIDLINKLKKETGWNADTCIRKCPEVQKRYGKINNIPRYCKAYAKELGEESQYRTVG